MHKMSKTYLGWSKFLSYFSHFEFLHKDKKTYLGNFAQMYSSYCVVQRKFFTKEATIHQTTANSYQQWEQHNAMGQIFDAFYGLWKI